MRTQHQIKFNDLNLITMKSLLTIFLSLVILTTGMSQTTRRVNNNVGISGTNVYATFALAHAAAIANDIIIIEPTTTSYGDITIAKPLKIYGSGYFLSTNTDLKADQRNSILGIVEFNTGSDGSEIYGIYGSTINIYGVSNITISRNYLTQYAITILNANKANTIFTNVTNITITRNYGTGASYFGASPTAGKTISNVLITNNILNYVSAVNDPGVQNWVVRNNTFYGGSSQNLVNSIFENNLLVNGGTLNFANVTSSYNISTGASFPSEVNGNKNNYPLSPLNQSGQPESELLVTGSPDKAFQIKAGSSLKALGSSSSEVGAYGGSSPYIVSGIPAIPSITTMVNTGTGDATTPVKVTISVKSNN